MTTYDLQFKRPSTPNWVSFLYPYRTLRAARKARTICKLSDPTFKYRIIKTLTTIAR